MRPSDFLGSPAKAGVQTFFPCRWTPAFAGERVGGA